jgi:uncharacterized protein (TIGR03083 family)
MGMSDVDVGALYAESRGRVTELLAGVTDEEAKAPVATCPGWSVHDVLAHLSGVCADVLSGNIAGVATDPWTAAQVDARRDKTLADVLAEWNELAPQVESFANNFPGRVGEQFVTDGVTHEHDIRHALGRPGARDSGSVRVGADFIVSLGLNAALATHGLGPLEVRGDSRTWIIGGSAPEASDDDTSDEEAGTKFFAAISEGQRVPEAGVSVGSLTASDFELMRAVTGRRSASQIAALDWTVDPAPYIAVFEFGPFTTSAVDIEE